MAIEIFLKQTLRGKARLILNLVLLCAVTAFLVVSINLYQNSIRNLQTVENTYSTIVALEFHGNVNTQGKLVSSSDPASVGNHLLTVFDYDLSTITGHSAVTGYDWRYRCAAYIPGETAVERQLSEDGLINVDGAVDLLLMRDQIRFTIDSKEPVKVPLQGLDSYENSYYVNICVLESAAELEYPFLQLAFTNSWSEEEIQYYAQDLRTINGSDEIHSITFYPGVEYTMSCLFRSCYWVLTPETGKYSYRAIIPGVALGGDMYTQETGLEYVSRFGETIAWKDEVTLNQPLSLQRSETIAADPELADYWAAAKDAVLWSAQSFALTLTDDMESIPAWHAGGMYLHDGRMITEEEYASGARVCMVNAAMADYHGWQVGDTLDMNLYTFASYQDDVGDAYLYGPWYGKNNDGFFDKGTYTIVGIYSQRELTGINDITPEIFYQPGNTIYAPTASVQNLPEQGQWPIQPSLLTIRLQNGTMAEYLKDMEALGLTDEQDGEYTIKFYADDQGYSKVANALAELNRNAKLLLSLSAVLMAVTMTLLSFLFSRQHKPSAGILRLLGGSKKQAFTAILVCAAAVMLAGGAIGTILGGVLTQSVGTNTLSDAAVSAKVALSTGASPVLTVLSGIGCVALFLLLTAIFTGTYIHKEPRALLPEDKG